MAHQTREDRIALQDHDHGGDEDTVYVVDSGSHNANRKTYHDDEDCPGFRRDAKREMTRNAAQLRWLAPCKICTVDGGNP